MEHEWTLCVRVARKEAEGAGGQEQRERAVALKSTDTPPNENTFGLCGIK